MAHLGEISGFGLGLQGGGATPTATATLLELLRGSMNGSSDRLIPRKTFKVRLGFNGCCGATWGFGPSSNMGVIDDDHDDDDHAADLGDEQEEEGGGSPEVENVGQTTPENGSTPACTGNVPASSGMNLAAALAAERQLRETQEFDGVVGFSPSLIRPSNNNNDSGVSAGTPTENRTPTRVSLMKLLAETDGRDDGETEKEGAGVDSVCCVCMGRKKGAAFIPCGHTFCRVCSRELWLNRGSCPLCNRSILEILDIF